MDQIPVNGILSDKIGIPEYISSRELSSKIKLIK